MHEGVVIRNTILTFISLLKPKLLLKTMIPAFTFVKVILVSPNSFITMVYCLFYQNDQHPILGSKKKCALFNVEYFEN